MEKEKNNKEMVPFEHYIEQFKNMDPREAANRCGLSYQEYEEGKGSFRVKLMNQSYEVSYPDFQIQCIDENGCNFHMLEQSIPAKILLIRYLTEGINKDAGEELLAYRNVPWGEVYLQQFTGRCIMRLAYSYGNRLDAFQGAMERMGATVYDKGDKSYRLEFMNGLYLYFILWAGDEEFPPSAQILFSDNFPSAFTAEDLAVIGDLSMGMMKQVAK